MKTAIIFSEVPESVYYLVLDGDYSRFNNVYINSEDSTDEAKDEMYSILYPEHRLVPGVSLEEFRLVIVDGAFLIEAGFLL